MWGLGNGGAWLQALEGLGYTRFDFNLKERFAVGDSQHDPYWT